MVAVRLIPSLEIALSVSVADCSLRSYKKTVFHGRVMRIPSALSLRGRERYPRRTASIERRHSRWERSLAQTRPDDGDQRCQQEVDDYRREVMLDKAAPVRRRVRLDGGLS